MTTLANISAFESLQANTGIQNERSTFNGSPKVASYLGDAISAATGAIASAHALGEESEQREIIQDLCKEAVTRLKEAQNTNNAY